MNTLFKKTVNAFIAVMGIVLISGCSNDSNLPKDGEYNLRFDKKELTFEAKESSGIIRILDTGNWRHQDKWGVNYVTIGEVVHSNTFVTKSEGGDTFNVYDNPVVGEWYSIEKDGSNIIIQLKENTGTERRMKISINAGANGQGEVSIFQEGK
ncbi:MAG: hypothetical protein LBG28_08700 [Tannerella sp.]|jgi:hypothetical protein|nr:hypothetical protein [Tannerella sp.]